MRTTVHPALTPPETLVALARELARMGVRRWVLQAFRPTGCASEALLAAAPQGAPIDDGIAAAALMGMNNVFYRFRHMIGKPAYGPLPARPRMQRLSQPTTPTPDFALTAIAAPAAHRRQPCASLAHMRNGTGATHASGAIPQRGPVSTVRIPPSHNHFIVITTLLGVTLRKGWEEHLTRDAIRLTPADKTAG